MYVEKNSFFFHLQVCSQYDAACVLFDALVSIGTTDQPAGTLFSVQQVSVVQHSENMLLVSISVFTLEYFVFTILFPNSCKPKLRVGIDAHGVRDSRQLGRLKV